jgi:hypothetical protein
MSPRLLLLLLLGCAREDAAAVKGPAGPVIAPDSAAPPDHSDGSDSLRDSAPPADTGLVWSGDLAPYGGCEPGDPPARLLSELAPTGPVTAGGVVSGEVVFANCEGATWVAATTEDAATGVKLAPVSETVMGQWSRPRVRLPADVPPGYAVRVRWEATAPLTNGLQGWQWQLVDEWVRWIESPTPRHAIEVSGGYGPFTVHPREDWEESAYPVDGPDMDLRDLEYITLHYNGVAADLDGDDDVYTDDDTVEDLRNTQTYTLGSTGYSSGYNVEIAPDGDEWEIRGYDIRNAASGCVEVNQPGFTLRISTASPEAAPTPAQIEGARAAILRIREAAAAAGNPNFLYLNGHRDVRPLCEDGGGTACPGEPIYALLLEGRFEP